MLSRVAADGRDFTTTLTTFLPPLRDVTIIRMLHGDLTTARFETIADRDYVQSWFYRLATREF